MYYSLIYKPNKSFEIKQKSNSDMFAKSVKTVIKIFTFLRSLHYNLNNKNNFLNCSHKITMNVFKVVPNTEGR